MLLKYTVENWMSFRDTATIWMTTDDDEFLNKRVPKIPKFDWTVIPIAALFGGNASGKSNFIEAIDFARWYILKGPKNVDSPIGVRPFKLDNFSKDSPTNMNFVVLVDEEVYDYSFFLTHKSVVSERLSKVTAKAERVLYERKGQEIEFFNSLKNNKYINIMSKRLRSNQLFLTTMGDDSVLSWPVYDWFKNSLTIIHPESEHIVSQYGDAKFRKRVNQVLSKLDCGLHSIEIQDVTESFEKTMPNSIRLALERGERFTTSDSRVELSVKEGELVAEKLRPFHQMKSGQLVEFTSDDESDGTQRILDLIPGFLELSSKNSKKVYVIDELDRSLHTLMCRNLLEAYLDNCTSESRSQLLFSAHDIFLMDKHMLRRDEMFITERLHDGSTVLSSIDDFEFIKTDYELYKDYLSGRFGGIPEIMFGSYDLSHYEEENFG